MSAGQAATWAKLNIRLTFQAMDEAPFTSRAGEPVQRELPETQDRLDEAEDRLRRVLAPRIEGTALGRRQLSLMRLPRPEPRFTPSPSCAR